MLYVVAYDISSDRVRDRMAEVLKSFGARVQGSVFEVRLPPSRLPELQRALDLVLGRRTKGEVRVYPVCEKCYSGGFALGAVASPAASSGSIVV
jgi:CRISPR-associated protein Cas2